MDVTTQQPQQMSVPLSRLIRDEANVRRKYDNDSIASMKASILAQGVIQPLAVRPPRAGDVDLGGQLYRVFAGGRRFRALGELVTEKQIDLDYPVPIIVRDVDDRQASEMSLTENIIRRSMEPADEFRAFKELADKGMSVGEIALRFGQSERFVKGRLALGALHPDILAAFERGDLTFEAVTAYTLNPDQEAQSTFFREAGQWSRRNVHDIKSAMRGGRGIRSDGKLASFIGEDAYLAAGGQVAEDLFGSDSQWISADVVERLQAEKIEQIKANALADGWSFFATTEELGLYGLYQASILEPAGDALNKEEYARMEELSEQLEGYDAENWQDDEMDKLAAEYEELDSKSGTYTADQKKLAGVAFDMNEFRWKVGVLRPGQEKKAGSGSASSGSAAKAKDPLALTQPLRDLIGDAATTAMKTAAIADPHRTLALIAAMLEQHENRTGLSRPSRLKVERIDINYGAKPEHKERTIKTAAASYVKMSSEELVTAVAGLFASTIDLTEKWLTKDFNYSHGEKRDEARQEYLALFEAKPVEAFDPVKYFAACTKPMIDAAMKEMTGHSAVKPKKAGMAREAAEAARTSGWLPEPLRLKGYKIKKVA